jgi:hypothetical protein
MGHGKAAWSSLADASPTACDGRSGARGYGDQRRVQGHDSRPGESLGQPAGSVANPALQHRQSGLQQGVGPSGFVHVFILAECSECRTVQPARPLKKQQWTQKNFGFAEPFDIASTFRLDALPSIFSE